MDKTPQTFGTHCIHCGQSLRAALASPPTPQDPKVAAWDEVRNSCVLRDCATTIGALMDTMDGVLARHAAADGAREAQVPRYSPSNEVGWMRSDPTGAWVQYEDVAAALRAAPVAEPEDIDDRHDRTRSLNLEMDIHRVLNWEKPLNNFKVVKELQDAIAGYAEAVERAKASQPAPQEPVSVAGDEELDDASPAVLKALVRFWRTRATTPQSEQPAAQEPVAWTEPDTMLAIKTTAAYGYVALTSEHGPYDISRPTFKCDRLVEAIVSIRDSQWKALAAHSGERDAS